jgi:hypothetical protein
MTTPGDKPVAVAAGGAMDAVAPPPPTAVGAVSPAAVDVAASPGSPDGPSVAPAPQPGLRLPPWKASFTAEDLTAMLRRVPELSLDAAAASVDGATDDKKRRQAAWTDLVQAVRQRRDQFLDTLVAKRPDLGGLPFLKGQDCQLDERSSKTLQAYSEQVRTLLGSSLTNRTTRPGSPDGSSADSIAFQLDHELARHRSFATAEALPALEQIITGESWALRLGLVRFLRSPPDSPIAARLLARRAVFDTSDDVRQVALAGLRFLSPRDYLPVLIGGLRYPWPAANFHAAEALVALRARSAIPDLIEVLDAPDPCAPFDVHDGGKRAMAVREVVRLNHHGSCLLCHAPSFAPGDAVRGTVPSPLQPLPGPSGYGSRRAADGELFIRADITYLRQDFSEVLPVDSAGPWPKQQRFDFVVRVRRLAEGEAQTRPDQDPQAGTSALPSSRQAALFALQQLTGADGGLTAATWRKALADQSQRDDVK